jgi:hypothetical protein
MGSFSSASVVLVWIISSQPHLSSAPLASIHTTANSRLEQPRMVRHLESTYGAEGATRGCRRGGTKERGASRENLDPAPLPISYERRFRPRSPTSGQRSAGPLDPRRLLKSWFQAGSRRTSGGSSSCRGAWVDLDSHKSFKSPNLIWTGCSRGTQSAARSGMV